MNANTPERFPELRRLLATFDDGNLSAEQNARIEQLVVEDAAARQFYLQMMFLYGQLRWKHLHESDECEMMNDEVRESTSEGSRVTSDKSSLPHSAFDLQPPILDVSVEHSAFSIQPSFIGSVLFSYLVATLILGSVLAVASAWKLPKYSQVAHQTISRPSSHAPGPASQTVFVGRITGMADCQWSDPHTAVPGPVAVPLGRKYALASGLMEITYDSGAKVILQGPVAYEVESAAGGFLSVGKVTAKVEKGPRSKVQGPTSATQHPTSRSPNPQSPIPNPSLSTLHSPLFTIKTPTAVVNDLGTEFGVEVNQSGITETEVFVGEVSVASTDHQKTTGRSPVVVRAGQTARVEKNVVSLLPSVESAKADKSRFVRAILSKGASYADLVLSMSPVAYYRMEPPKDPEDRNVVFDSAPGRHNGMLRLSDDFGGNPWWPGRFGKAVYLRGPDFGDYAVVSDYPKAADDELTVSAWVYAVTRSPAWSLIAANWGMDVHGQFHFGLEREGDLTIEVSPRDSQYVLIREGASHPLPTLQWQHVAFVVDKSTVHLYRNAVEVASGPCQGLLPNPPLPNLMIGSKNDDTGGHLTKPPLNWHGRIDELAIFNRALNLEQIRELHRGRSTAGVNPADADRVSDSAATTVQP